MADYEASISMIFMEGVTTPQEAAQKLVDWVRDSGDPVEVLVTNLDTDEAKPITIL